MKISILILFGIMTILIMGSVNAAWANTTFSECINITVKNAGATTLTDFPTYINIPDDPGMLPDYSDLRFYNASCNNNGSLLNYEIENYTSANAIVWVKIPTLSTGNTIISVYFKNSTPISSGQNATGVWNANFKGVWHLEENSAPYTDSTSNGNNGTTTSAPTRSSGGMIDGAQTFDGVNTFINISDTTSLRNLSQSNPTTWSAWVKANTNASGVIMSKEDNDIQTGWWIGVANTAVRTGIGVDFPYLTTDTFRFTKTGFPAVGTWFYLTVTYNGTSATPSGSHVYINGIEYAYSNQSSGVGARSTTDAGYPFYIGLGPTSGAVPHFNGTIDEVEISNITRSIDWINESYLTVANQTSFVTFGAVQMKDTCTYIGSGNWAITCSDNCTFTTAQIIPLGNNVTTTGTGILTFNNGGRWSFTGANQYVNINSGCSLAINSGGGFF